MKLYNENELRELIKTNKITYSEDSLVLDNDYIDDTAFVASMKQIIGFSQRKCDKMESDNFSDYGKGNGQKSKNKRRKSK